MINRFIDFRCVRKRPMITVFDPVKLCLWQHVEHRFCLSVRNHRVVLSDYDFYRQLHMQVCQTIPNVTVYYVYFSREGK